MEKMYLINNKQGHTLLEMLIVLAILGMITLLVLPLYPASAARQEIEFAIQQFEEDYFYVQQKAITESKEHRIMTNPLHSFYYVDEWVQNSSGEIKAKRLFSRFLPEGLTFLEEKALAIDFDRHGQWSGGNVTFTYRLEGKLHWRRYVFQVNTGRFRVEDHVY